MFKDAYKFNSDISGWYTGNGVYFNGMFNNAKAMHQDISLWNTNKATGWLDFYKFSNFWSSQIPPKFR